MHFYSQIKGLVKWIIPKRIWFRYEYAFRYLYYIRFIGSKYACNICNAKIRSFIRLNDDKLCPRCGSLQRTRRLWNLLDTEFLTDSLKILDFSPSRSIYRLMKKRSCSYISSDLSGDFFSDASFDITNIGLAANSQDLVICYHILEHIDDDIQAMNELWRVLKNGGTCIVQTPLKEGEICENYSITSPKEREIHFGQSDHVRIYSTEGLVSRLEGAGFKVEIRNYAEAPDNFYGYNTKETVFICHKPE